MASRAWQLWGTSAVLAGGLVALAQTPPEINGKATPAITQDHFQPEVAPPPRLLPQQVREARPSKPSPTTAGRNFFGNVTSVQTPAVPAPDLDTPIRVTHSGASVPALASGDGLPPDWKARAAFDVAEMYFDACELDEARDWYQEAIKLAPGTKVAAVAAERLERMALRPAPGQSSEPPLANAIPRQTQARIR